jgi:MoaA/NifB/PqqE/SkfB family radical SAM enzyme
MCAIAGLLPKEEELSTEKVLRVVDEVRRYGIPEILLTGGEPFLREDIFAICAYIRKNNLRSIITTNAACIDKGLVEEIDRSGISHLHVSLDGLEDTHDFFRGSGVFKKAVAAIEMLNQKRSSGNHFSIGVACTVMDRNVRELSGLVKFLDEMGVDVINFQPLVKDNAKFIDKGTPPFWLKEEDILVLIGEIERIRNYRPRHITLYEEPPLELFIAYYQRRLTKKEWMCFGGFKTAFICYEKNKPLVYSCHGICGDLDQVSLKKAWRSKQARSLRMHSRDCADLCLQSCYSQYTAQSLSNIAKFYLKKMSRNGK